VDGWGTVHCFPQIGGPRAYNVCMNNTTASQVHQFDLDIAPALRDFMGSNLCDLNDCVDWVCDVFDLNATDWLIDRIADEFEEFFGV
jgi:hypothetical protein